MPLMNWSRFKPSKNAVFAILLIGSGLALKLPPGFSDWTKHVMQHLGPCQHVAYSSAFRATQAVAAIDESETVSRLKLENSTPRHSLMSLAGEVESLRREKAGLMNIRENFIPRELPLMRARIVSRDIVASRDGLVIDRGASRKVGDRDWVASRFFIDEGATAGLDAGQVALVRESLLGRIEQVKIGRAHV